MYGTSFDGTVNMLFVVVNWSKKRLTLQKFVVSDNSFFFFFYYVISLKKQIVCVCICVSLKFQCFLFIILPGNKVLGST